MLFLLQVIRSFRIIPDVIENLSLIPSNVNLAAAEIELVDQERKEYSELVKKLNHFAELYYSKDEPEISDYEYDRLMQSLKAAEREHPERVTPDSPSRIIGGTAKREAGVKVPHNVPMLSIEDVCGHPIVPGMESNVSFEPVAKGFDTAAMNLILNMQRLKIERPDKYMIRLIIDDEEYVALPLYALEVPHGNGDGSDGEVKN